MTHHSPLGLLRFLARKEPPPPWDQIIYIFGNQSTGRIVRAGGIGALGSTDGFVLSGIRECLGPYGGPKGVGCLLRVKYPVGYRGLVPAERRHDASSGEGHDTRERGGLGVVRPHCRVVRVPLVQGLSIMVDYDLRVGLGVVCPDSSVLRAPLSEGLGIGFGLGKKRLW